MDWKLHKQREARHVNNTKNAKKECVNNSKDVQSPNHVDYIPEHIDPKRCGEYGRSSFVHFAFWPKQKNRKKVEKVG
jgi:hypothetical protein